MSSPLAVASYGPGVGASPLPACEARGCTRAQARVVRVTDRRGSVTTLRVCLDHEPLALSAVEPGDLVEAGPIGGRLVPLETPCTTSAHLPTPTTAAASPSTSAPTSRAPSSSASTSTPRARLTVATPASTPPTTSPGSRPCAVPGCFNDAVRGHLCDEHRRGPALTVVPAPAPTPAPAPPPPAPEPAPMPARKPDPPPCRWPGCTSKAAGPHGYCNRDRMRITSSLKVDPRQFTPEQLAGLWAEHQGRSVGRPAPAPAPQAPCKAPDCTRPAGGLGWCEPCRRMLARMALAPETTTPEAFAEARARRAAATSAKLATPKHHGLPVTTTWPEPAGKLREDLRRAFGMDDGASDDEIVARAEKAVADLAAQAHAAGELVTLAEKHADAATVALAERDALVERVVALEADLAAYRTPMTEEELRLRGNALARAALEREWALARAPRGAR